MTTIQQKTVALITAYGNQENLNYILKVLGNEIAHSILQEPCPVPPLKAKIKYDKRRSIAQRSVQNDSTLQDITYRLLVAKYPVDTNNSETELKTYLEQLVNELAQVTIEEANAVIPVDETLN